MRSNAAVEEIPQFDVEVIGISCLNGVPSGIIFFHEGRLLSAEFTNEHAESVPVVPLTKRTITTINAPNGMKAVIKGKRITREYSKDFRAIMETKTIYEVVNLDKD